MGEDDTVVTITHAALDNGGLYTAHVEGEDAKGTLEWEHDPHQKSVSIATHTIVPKAIGGRGVAARLVGRLIADAREQHFQVDPQCWYVARKFDHNPEWADLRA